MVEESSVSFDAYDASLKNSIFQHGSGDGISPELIWVSSSPPMPVSTKSGFSSEIQFKAVNTPYQYISSYTLHTYWLDNDSSATDENGLQTEEETVLFSNLSFLAISCIRWVCCAPVTFAFGARIDGSKGVKSV